MSCFKAHDFTQMFVSFHNIFSSRSFMNEAMTLGDALTCMLGHKTQVIKTLSIHYIGKFFSFSALFI